MTKNVLMQFSHYIGSRAFLCQNVVTKVKKKPISLSLEITLFHSETKSWVLELLWLYMYLFKYLMRSCS